MVEKAAVGVGDGEDRVEDCGQVEGVDGRGEGGNDDGAGLWEA